MTTQPKKPPSGETPAWMQRKERGNLFLLRLMCWLSLKLGRKLTRILVHGIALYFVLAAPSARKASRSYLTRVLERPVTWTDLYRHILAFASTIHDRFYLLSDQSDLFDIQVFGSDSLYKCRDCNKGALLLGAHMGSFEILLTHGKMHRHKMAIAMYPENARQLNSILAAINPKAVQGIISLGQFDSMLGIHNKLEDGSFVGVLADRAVGPDQYISAPFLGATARFPTGPFRMAAMLRHPVYFMTGLYCGDNRYEVHFELLADFSEVSTKGRDADVRETLLKYVAELERHCKLAPFNWFNFYDFWESACSDTV